MITQNYCKGQFRKPMNLLLEKWFSIMILNLAGRCQSDDNSSSFNTLSITRYDGLEDYFTNLYLKKSASFSSSDSSRRLSFKIRSTHSPPGQLFCKRMLNSTFFVMKRKKFVDMLSEEVIQEIKNYYPIMFREMYEARNSFLIGNRYTTKADPKLQPVYARGTELRVNVHTCLARDLKTHEIRQYFISDEYYHNMETASSSSSVRFLFSADFTRRLIVYAVLEEPAWNMEGEYDIEKAYLNAGPARKRYKNLICKLSRGEKLRLCASVMHSVNYKRKVRFWPTLYYVSPICIKRTISFLHHDAADDTHNAWMVSCRGESLKTGMSQTYYLCLAGYSVTPVFVLKMEDSKFYLDHYAEVIPVLLEKD